MKMAELEQDRDYLEASGTDWLHNAHRCMRVVVLSTDRLVSSNPRYGYGRDDAATMQFVYDGKVYTAAARKAGLYGDRVDAALVLPVNPETGQPREDAKPRWAALRDLRGPWAETWAKVQAVNAEAAARRKARDEAHRAERERLTYALDFLRAKGATVPETPGWNRTQVTLTAEHLESIVALLKD